MASVVHGATAPLKSGSTYTHKASFGIIDSGAAGTARASGEQGSRLDMASLGNPHLQTHSGSFQFRLFSVQGQLQKKEACSGHNQINQDQPYRIQLLIIQY